MKTTMRYVATNDKEFTTPEGAAREDYLIRVQRLAVRIAEKSFPNISAESEMVRNIQKALLHIVEYGEFRTARELNKSRAMEKKDIETYSTEQEMCIRCGVQIGEQCKFCDGCLEKERRERDGKTQSLSQ